MSPHFYTTHITKKSCGQFKHEIYFFLSPLLDWSWHGKEPLPAQSGDTFTPHETRKHSVSLPTSRVERTFIISWRILEFLYQIFTDLPVSRPSFRNPQPFISAGKTPITKIFTRMRPMRCWPLSSSFDGDQHGIICPLVFHNPRTVAIAHDWCCWLSKHTCINGN